MTLVWRKREALAFALTVLSARAAPVPAQVIGTLPEKSPFGDIRGGHRTGLVGGYMVTSRDPAGVGPRSGPLIGARYDLHAGGPTYLTGRVFGFSSGRDVLDFTKKAALRRVGTQTSTIVGTDVGLTLSLTGDRSWHSIQPLVHSGVGLAFALGDKLDVSQYRFSSQFSFSWGCGARWATGRNSELRADVAWYYWKLKYPVTFRSTEGDSIAIRPSGSMTPWTGNRAMTVSWTWGIFR